MARSRGKSRTKPAGSDATPREEREKNANPQPVGSEPTEGGKEMAGQESRFQDYHSPTVKLFTDLMDVWYSTARKMTEYYLAAGEDLARGAVESQRQATRWARDVTPLFEEQNNVAREFVERSTDVARRLVQVQVEKGEEAVRRV
jgi:hypothetical protein